MQLKWRGAWAGHYLSLRGRLSASRPIKNPFNVLTREAPQFHSRKKWNSIPYEFSAVIAHGTSCLSMFKCNPWAPFPLSLVCSICYIDLKSWAPTAPFEQKTLAWLSGTYARATSNISVFGVRLHDPDNVILIDLWCKWGFLCYHVTHSSSLSSLSL